MTRAYIRLDPAFDERKEDYPDGPYRTLIAVLCHAETQPIRGRFRSLTFLKALLGRCGRHVNYLVSHGDLYVLDGGKVYVVGWDEWQEGDWKVGERIRRIRNRRNGGCNAPERIQGHGAGNGSPYSGGGGGALAEAAGRAPATDEQGRQGLASVKDVLDQHGLIPHDVRDT